MRTKLETFPTIETPRKNDLANCTSTARWSHIQNVLLHFWKRWHKEYVTSLQERKKWGKEVTNLKVGDVVFTTDDNMAPLQWPLGRGQGHFVTSHLGDNMASVIWATKVSTKWVDQIDQLTDIFKEVNIFLVWLGRFAPFAK